MADEDNAANTPAPSQMTDFFDGDDVVMDTLAMALLPSRVTHVWRDADNSERYQLRFDRYLSPSDRNPSADVTPAKLQLSDDADVERISSLEASLLPMLGMNETESNESRNNFGESPDPATATPRNLE